MNFKKMMKITNFLLTLLISFSLSAQIKYETIELDEIKIIFKDSTTSVYSKKDQIKVLFYTNGGLEPEHTISFKGSFGNHCINNISVPSKKEQIDKIYIIIGDNKKLIYPEKAEYNKK
jgi:hypothetical protein